MKRPMDVDVVRVSWLHSQERSFVADVFEGIDVCWREGWSRMF